MNKSYFKTLKDKLACNHEYVLLSTARILHQHSLSLKVTVFHLLSSVFCLLDRQYVNGHCLDHIFLLFPINNSFVVSFHHFIWQNNLNE